MSYEPIKINNGAAAGDNSSITNDIYSSSNFDDDQRSRSLLAHQYVSGESLEKDSMQNL